MVEPLLLDSRGMRISRVAHEVGIGLPRHDLKCRNDLSDVM
ncbi:hypothetical protein BX261_7200 [Streptomyces sp. 2321.6]|nr:hypothetical protein BX261_7200 [Streptomyces sp. 2321.6]SNC74239.1 hypothetical protein SAMN06272741_7125 [Streptomyces sp. 2114.4]